MAVAVAAAERGERERRCGVDEAAECDLRDRDRDRDCDWDRDLECSESVCERGLERDLERDLDWERDCV